jgi:hypothetical protein
MLAMHRSIADRTLTVDVAGGFLLGASSLAVSFLAGLGLLHNQYYVEWLAAAIMGFYLLIAWFLWLRDDAFMKRRKDESASLAQGDTARGGQPAPASSKRARRVFLSASLFLALATIVLYFGFGIGASF